MALYNHLCRDSLCCRTFHGILFCTNMRWPLSRLTLSLVSKQCDLISQLMNEREYWWTDPASCVIVSKVSLRFWPHCVLGPSVGTHVRSLAAKWDRIVCSLEIRLNGSKAIACLSNTIFREKSYSIMNPCIYDCIKPQIIGLFLAPSSKLDFFSWLEISINHGF